MTLARRLSLGALLVLLAGGPARADATAFIGATTTPANRLNRGFAIGTGLMIVGFEFEYCNTGEDTTVGAPSLTTGMANAMLQTPVAIFGFQPYVLAGAGLYRETLGTIEDTNFTVATGAGVKISLIGPLRLRVDYRLLKLGSSALYTPVHRVYAGVNVKF